MENIQDLQKSIEYLEKENKYLKALLDNAKIPYGRHIRNGIKGRKLKAQGRLTY